MSVRKTTSRLPIFLQLSATVIIWSLVGYVLGWLIYTLFHAYKPGKPPEFVGFANILAIFTDERLFYAVLRTVYYAGLGTLIEVLLGMFVALALVNFIKSDKVRFAVLMLFLLPMCLAEAVASVIWIMLATPEGYINCFLRALGLKPIGWLARGMSLNTLMIADIWQWTPLPILLIYAARTSIPAEMYESAELERLSSFTIFRVVTWPFIKYAVIVAALLRLIFMYITIDKFILITYGGPGFSSEIIGFYVFLQSFSYRNIGYGATLSFATLVVAGIITYFFWNTFRRKE